MAVQGAGFPLSRTAHSTFCYLRFTSDSPLGIFLAGWRTPRIPPSRSSPKNPRPSTPPPSKTQTGKSWMWCVFVPPWMISPRSSTGTLDRKGSAAMECFWMNTGSALPSARSLRTEQKSPASFFTEPSLPCLLKRRKPWWRRSASAAPPSRSRTSGRVTFAHAGELARLHGTLATAARMRRVSPTGYTSLPPPQMASRSRSISRSSGWPEVFRARSVS